MSAAAGMCQIRLPHFWSGIVGPVKPQRAKRYRHYTAPFHGLTQAQRQQIRAIYAECKRQRQFGKDVHVDHIVPLSSPYVCGFHVPWNLQIIPAATNAHKGNLEWPGHPDETRDMFGKLKPHQLGLAI
jgi:hypothetical protein